MLNDAARSFAHRMSYHFPSNGDDKQRAEKLSNELGSMRLLYETDTRDFSEINIDFYYESRLANHHHIFLRRMQFLDRYLNKIREAEKFNESRQKKYSMPLVDTEDHFEYVATERIIAREDFCLHEEVMQAFGHPYTHNVLNEELLIPGLMRVSDIVDDTIYYGIEFPARFLSLLGDIAIDTMIRRPLERISQFSENKRDEDYKESRIEGQHAEIND